MRPEGSHVRAEPAVRAHKASPSDNGSPPLGWSSRSLLIWALAGWGLAALLGTLLWVHVTLRSAPPPSTETTTHEAPPPTSIEPTETPAVTPAPAPTTVVVTARPVVEPRKDPEEADSDDGALVAAYLRHAAVFTEAGEFDKALASYDQALALQPDNPDFLLLRSQVDEMRSFSSRSGGAMPLALRQSATVYVPPAYGDAPGNFRTPNEDAEVRRATTAPDFPGELVMTLRPRRFEPGAPYVAAVRLYNKGNRVIYVDTVEVVFRHGSRAHGLGERHAARVPRVAPRDTALLWERQRTWQDDQGSGRVDITVHLVSGGKLTKEVSW